MEPVFRLLELSEELIVQTLRRVPDAKTLAAASSSCRSLQKLSHVALQQRLPGAVSLVQLHLSETLSHVSRDNEMLCALFYTASAMLTPKSKTGLQVAADIMKKHPEMTCHIDGHVHVGAPDEVAVHFSKMRAHAVRKQLVDFGIDKTRCEVTAWGKKVASAEDWPASPEYSRAELTFEYKSLCFPDRRVFCCNLEPPEDTQPGQEEDDDAGDDDESDGHGDIGFMRGIPISLILRHVLGPRHMVPANFASNDDSDDESGEGDEEMQQPLVGSSEEEQ
eukprot:TRINITY_DN90999_c0_g1_i1.p1 TRINITY_DN90999_c0_g1~~TRINITY_DN90999_c0_g1_i1.p1  ORF type:complete len:278 (-),score=60.45 TRINITY_DN90999_c0_g1_i1:299-1132(-)